MSQYLCVCVCVWQSNDNPYDGYQICYNGLGIVSHVFIYIHSAFVHIINFCWVQWSSCAGSAHQRPTNEIDIKNSRSKITSMMTLRVYFSWEMQRRHCWFRRRLATTMSLLMGVIRPRDGGRILQDTGRGGTRWPSYERVRHAWPSFII